MHVSGSLIRNIDEGRLIEFLKKKNIKHSEEEMGLDTNIWVGKLIDENRIDVEDLNEHFFSDLFYGQRRLMRIYKLRSVRMINKNSDWINGICSQFDINSLDFNNIVGTGVGTDAKEQVKIAAIKTTFSSTSKIENIRILFAKHMVVRENGNDTYTCSYLPVEFNLNEKIVIIKVRNRQYYNENYSSDDLMDSIIKLLFDTMNIEISNFEHNPQEVLYRMTKGLLDEFFNTIPNINQIETLTEPIACFVNNIINSGIYTNIEQTEINGKNYSILNKDILDLNEEIAQLLQQAAAFDYFRNFPIDSITDSITAILVSIRFNDIDNASARLTGEKRTRAIFNSKTFMSIRKSIDLVASVVALSIAYNKKRGRIIVKYDTSDNGFLKIHILNNRYYDESDFNNIWEMYKSYESELVEDTGELRISSII
jgi:hypothetical protein